MMLLEYLLKSAACMGAFLLFYQFLLERENMHLFKRFFLLAALGTSLIIPALVFTEYVEVAPVDPIVQTDLGDAETLLLTNSSVTDMDVVNWSLVFWTIYGLGVAGFGFRFIKHLIQINFRVRKNPKLKQSSFTQVLLNEKMPPHTFFKFIFLNKNDVEKKKIPTEVLLHEKTHAKQLHSIDVLFIELLQVLLWFNPLVYLFKKNIKLNHEFLADSAVLKETTTTKNYQNILLSYLSQASEKKYQSVNMANAINYSSIKKRFTIMKTETSKKSRIIKSMLVLPLAAMLLFGFSQKKTIYASSDSDREIIQVEKNNYRTISFHIVSKDIIELQGKTYNSSEIKNAINELIENEIPLNRIHLFGSTNLKLENDLFKKLESNLSTLGVGKITFCEEGCAPDEFDVCADCPGESATKAEIKQYEILAGKYNSISIESRVIPLTELKVLESIYRKMTLTQKENAQPFPECLPKNQQQTATMLEVKEYNALAKKYYELPVNKSLPLTSKTSTTNELKRIDYIYNLMSDEQRANAEPYPFLKLEKYPQESATREQMATYNALAKKYNDMDRNNMRIALKDVEQLKYIYSIMSDKQKADAEPFPDFPEPPKPPSPKVIEVEPNGKKITPTSKKIDARGKDGKGTSAVPEPPTFRSPPEVHEVPTPPTPPDPLDHIVAMAKKGADFYYEGNAISSDKAIELLKKNKSLHIQTTKHDSNNPQVKISKKPITFKH